MSWLRTTPIKAMVGALEFAAECSSSLPDKPEVWRWTILSLHLGLEGALVCALKGFDTSGVAVLSNASGRRTMEWLEAGAPDDASPNQQLAPMRELLKRAQTYLPPPHRLSIPSHVVDDLLRLNEIRNNVAHLVVDGWSLDTTGLPRIALNTIRVIEHLALKEPTFWHQYEGNDRERLQLAVGNLTSYLQSLRTTFDEMVR